MKEKDGADKNNKIPMRETERELTHVEIFVGNNGMLIKIASIIILAAFIFVVFSDANVKDVDISEIKKALNKNTDITSVMKEMNNSDLMHFMNINANDYDQVLYYRNTMNLAVDELLIAKSDNNDNLAAVASAVEERIDSQLKAYDSYGPDQCALLNNAIRIKKGNYFYYCTAENAEEYEEVLLDVIQ